MLPKISLVTHFFINKKGVNFDLIGAIFSPNYFDTSFLYTNSIVFKLYTNPTVSIHPTQKIQKNHKLFQNSYFNQTVSKIRVLTKTVHKSLH